MKLTNESVAKALGYRCTNKTGGIWFAPNDQMSKRPLREIPDFIHSLDAITAEIEARGLRWTIDASLGEPRSVQAYVKWMSGASLIHEQAGAEQSTAPLALCAALLAYLKDRP